MHNSILIVDDDPRIRASIPGALESEALDVRTAEDAERALSLLGERPADVVLSDIRRVGCRGARRLTSANRPHIARGVTRRFTMP